MSQGHHQGRRRGHGQHGAVLVAKNVGGNVF